MQRKLMRNVRSWAYRFLEHAKLARIYKRRLFFRGLRSPSYNLRHEINRLRKVPRVIRAGDLNFEWGPQYFNAQIVTPKRKISQVLSAHYVLLAPGGKSQKHGHMNEAVFYVLDGKGHDIHDGVRHDWEAGDVVVVKNACVHQHFNDDPDLPARAIVIKSKPLYLFMNMVMQADIEKQPKEPVAGQEDFKPTYFPE